MTRLLRKILLLPALAVSVALAAGPPAGADQPDDWPRFRGPDGGGVYAKGDVPLSCDLKTGANIAWSVESSLDGYGSPVVWGEHVFISGGDDSKREVASFDLRTGALEWKSAVPDGERSETPDQSGMAAATPATDGRRVYAIFANGDLVAFNFDGGVAWSKNLGAPKNGYGHATSLLTVGERVIVQLDQGDAEDKLSKLIAFDGATGTVAWEQPRAAGASWATPITFDAAGRSQILALGVPWAISYAAKDGAEIWRAECLDGEVAPSPVFAGGMVFVVSPLNKLQAISPGGSGDVTKTHLGWIAEDGIPDVTSPVSNGELVFLVDTGGTITCYDARTGRKQWQHDLEEECKASPSIVGGKLILISLKGTVIAVDAAREFHEAARSALGEEVFASPAFASGKIIVRGRKHLICIGAK
ncbi:MAG: PQQ-like beta-propeller repeat protein [Verrucomicrobiaceae bacterium]|nr:PQQ-like beta-propeller repeat protein [Verrucomicrobiaceae bacterium]